MSIRNRLEAERREIARDRERLTFEDLAQELRTFQTGVQIPFAFLLSLAFGGRFTSLDGFELGVYIGTLILTVITYAIIATPVALHRTMGRDRPDPRIMRMSAHMAEIGIALVSFSLNGAVLLVTDFIVGPIAAACITFATFSIFTGLWLFLPKALNLRHNRPVSGRRHPEETDPL